MTTSETRPVQGASEIRDGMRIDWDVPIEMDDGIVLRADVFRPIDETPVPALVTYGPYCKALRLSDHHPLQWERLTTNHPEVLVGSTGKYQAWETPDPEKWVAFGYACVRVDSRGAGRSPGYLDPHSHREIRDASACVEWAAAQPWATDKVGMLGISYYADNAWHVAAQDDPPPHLAAICPWEGSTNTYRETMRHGGILVTFIKNWWTYRILPIQHGLGERGYRSPNTGELASGPETLTEEELAANRADVVRDYTTHVLDDEWTRARAVDFDKLRVPFLSAANWGGLALHLRGNVEAFVRGATEHKWLAFHGLEHWTHFYTDYGLDLQRRFFDCFLKDDDSGWKDQPRVLVNVRRPGEIFEPRGEDDWPLPDTRWTRHYLDASALTLAAESPQSDTSVSFEALSDGVTFLTPPFEEETEITGPGAAKLFVSSSTTDADLFLVFQLFDPNGNQVMFQGTMDPMTCISKGWLRASHRKLDRALTREHRPYHTHDEIQPLVPGDVYELDVEIWPTSIVVPAGHRIGITVLGRDYFHAAAAKYDNFGSAEGKNGSGGMLHDDPDDRPEEVFGGTTTIHTGPSRECFLMLPVIPPRA